MSHKDYLPEYHDWEIVRNATVFYNLYKCNICDMFCTIQVDLGYNEIFDIKYVSRLYKSAEFNIKLLDENNYIEKNITCDEFIMLKALE